MTRDSDGGRPQKTVAELLAEHGGQVGGTPRRRRRRAAEDDGPPQPGVTDTAPQAIIDRVRAEGPPPGGGAPNGRPRGRAAEGEEPPRGRPGQPRTGQQPVPPRRPQNSGGYPAPGGGEGAARPPRPPRGQGARPAQESSPPTPSSPPPSTAHSTGYGKPTTNGFRLPPKQQSSGPNPVPPGGGTTGTTPKPPPPSSPNPPPHDAASRMTATRRVPVPAAPVPSPQEGTLAARLDGLGEGDEQEPPTPGAQPPAGRAQRSGRSPLPPRRRRPPRSAPAPQPEPHTEQLPAVSESDAEKTTLSEPVSADEPPAGLVGWPGHRGSADDPAEATRIHAPAEATQIHAPAALGTEDVDTDDEGPATGYYVPDFDDDADDLGAVTRVGALDDDPLGESGYDTRYGTRGDADDPYGDAYADDDYDDEDDEDDLDHSGKGKRRQAGEPGDADEGAVEDGSPAKQWLVLAGQLALGVAGGAGVWLGFNWLWGKLPAAALIAALVVTVGLVWVVRKVRRAEDTQTTVLALLVGLVVTVSPAALLLVSR